MLFNMERARGLMSDLGVDVLIATTPENVTYMSGYAAWGFWTYRGNTPKKGAQAYAIFPRDSGTPPALIPSSTGYTTFAYLAMTPSWIEEYYPYESKAAWMGGLPEFEIPPDIPHGGEIDRLKKFLADAQTKKSPSSGHALVRALKDRGLTKGVVALDTVGINPAAHERLSTDLPDLNLKDGSELFRLIRAVKTNEEIELLRRSAAINEIAFNGMIEAIRPGMTELEMVKVHRAITVSMGATPTFLNTPAGPRSGIMWSPSDNILAKGDAVWMDGGNHFKHYHSDTGTCAVLGEPTKRMHEIYASVEAGMNAGLDRVRPGAKASEVFDNLQDALRKSGVEHPFGFGHGIGIEERDHPICQRPFADFSDGLLSGSSELTLETGMVINVEVNHFEFGVGGLKSENTVVVNSSGWELITPQERKIHVIS